MKKKMKKKEQHVNEEVETMTESAMADDAFSGEAEELIADDHDIPDAAVSDAEDTDRHPMEGALAAVTQERDEFRDQVLRARAEFDNFRKRTARDSEQLRKTAAQGLMRDLLPIIDNLERALGHVEDKTSGLALGVEMIMKQFASVLSAQGLDPIPAKGEPFDPNVHEALTHQPSEEYPADTVMEEFQRGYRLGDFVLRPSQVVVSSGPPAPRPAEESESVV